MNTICVICAALLVSGSSGLAQVSPQVIQGAGQSLPPGTGSLTPQQIQRGLDQISPGQIRDAINHLSPEDAATLKRITGVDPKDLPNLSPDEIAAVIQRLKDSGIDWSNIPEQYREQIIAVLDQRLKIQRFIDRDNPPFMLDDRGPKQISGLDYSQLQNLQLPQSVLQAAHSVGKIVDPMENLIGTGWVIQPGIIATNCHVGLMILARGQGTMPNDLVMDFSAASDKDLSKRAFALTRVLYLSREKGLDLALLAVDSRNGAGRNLPAPLKLGTISRLPIRGYFVGYASGTEPSSGSLDTREFANAISRVGPSAKLASRAQLPALVSYQGFGVLLHNASTHFGSSGSPLLNKDGEVVAVHNCCNQASDFVPGNTCASTTVVTPYNNQSITAGAFSEIAEIKKILSQN